MERRAFDTSVIVAALMSWHEFHEPARRALSKALRGETEVIVPIPVLFECYAVMTRLPPPNRLAPSVVLQLLDGTFRGNVRLVALPPDDRAWLVLEHLAAANTAGGSTYDAHIAACARAGGASVIYTYNPRHFESYADEELKVVVPG